MNNGPTGGTRAKNWPRIVVSAAVAAVVLVSFASSCNSMSNEVDKYIKQIRPILDSVTAKLNDLRKYFNLPLADQGGMKKSLTALRKVVKEGQDKLDALDPPEPCRELDRLMGDCIFRARDTADLSTQFADYLGDMAPLAEQVNDLIANIGRLAASNDVASGTAALVAEGNRLASGYYTVVAPALFQDVHKTFGAFVQMVNSRLAAAAKMAGDRGGPGGGNNGHGGYQPAEETAPQPVEETSPEPEETSPTEPEPEPEPEEPGDTRESGSIEATLAIIPAEWPRVNADIGIQLAELRESTGLTAKQQQFDELVVQIMGKIAMLQKEYELK